MRLEEQIKKLRGNAMVLKKGKHEGQQWNELEKKTTASEKTANTAGSDNLN